LTSCLVKPSKKFLRIHWKLLVKGFLLGFGNEFLKTWIVADRVPHGIDLQARNGNDLTGRESDQLANYFYRFLGVAGARFDFS
jgi:hypothetical protein